MIPALVVGINAHQISGNYSVTLQELVGKKRLVVPVTVFEARAIDTCLSGAAVPRPQTHDLLRRLLETLEVKINKVVIHDADSDAFLSRIALQTGSGILNIDAQPGDAIALALRTHASIFVEDRVLLDHGISALSDAPPMNREQMRSELERQLQLALENENYEDAARLRDTILALENHNL